jgi:hypothetical protein
MPAHMTAKIVIASAERLMDVRHFCRNKKRIALINVPAWPMPTQNTKLTIAQPQPTGLFKPQTPTPSQKSQAKLTAKTQSKASEATKAIHQRDQS